MRILVALGGNALLRENETPGIAVQMRNAEKAVNSILFLIKKQSVVITHGNGPQVGNILIRSEESKGKAYSLPLSVCGAQSQGEIAFILETALRNLLLKHKINRNAASLITFTEVEKKDKAFSNPTKPIGPFLNLQQADLLRKKGISVKEDSGRGYRRVVPSPTPKKIIGEENIKNLLEKNSIVIAVGGGGIPVFRNKKYERMEAVIDKDRASACLAASINAEVFVILTEVPNVYLNYNKQSQKALHKITFSEAKKYLSAGHFAEGSMKPKIEAAIYYLEKMRQKNKKARVIITNPQMIKKAFSGKEGTVITQ